MTPFFVLPETVVRDDGHSPEIALEASMGRALMLTLGITRVLERETLEVSIQGSRDGSAWQRLAAFPKKSYCGTYSLLVDLANQPEMRYLRVYWTVDRWDNAMQKPVFAFFVSGEQLRARVAGAA
jgi:hypothetical protein